MRGAPRSAAAATAPPGPADWLADIIPTNAMPPPQGAMLPLVVFALFLGFALPKIDGERRAQIPRPAAGHQRAMIVVALECWAAPLGVFAVLVLAVTAKVGFDLIGAPSATSRYRAASTC